MAYGWTRLGWLLAAALGWSGMAAAQQVVRLGTTPEYYPPFTYIEADGRVAGFEADIANALCERMQVQCEWVLHDWDGIIPALLEGKFDAIVASMSITVGRQQVVDFTDRYYQSPTRFIRAKNTGIEILATDLRGRTVGVQEGTTMDNYVSDLFGHLVRVQRFATQEEVYAALQKGAVDLGVADMIAARDGFITTDEGRRFEFVGPFISDKAWLGNGVGIAVRKRSDDLREAFNRAIAEIRADGTYKRIQDQYFDFDIYGE